MVEILESRRMMSTSVAVSHSGGVLTLQGTNNDEYIFVQESSPGVFKVITASSHNGFAPINPVEHEVTGPVTHVVINAGHGSDYIDFLGRTVRSTIDAGDGADVVVVEDHVDQPDELGRRIGSVVDGGNDNDSFTVRHGHGTLIHGENGKDTFLVQGGDSEEGPNELYTAILYGDNGIDTFSVSSGKVWIDGGTGKDVLASAPNPLVETQNM